MPINETRRAYFEWLSDLAVGDRYSQVTYQKLLVHLYNTSFHYSIEKDRNRVEDGLDLRWRFVDENSNTISERDRMEKYLSGPCSVLEMMIALAIRCEETIMDDPSFGNRTGQWFWSMIVSLGLGSMTDDRYDEIYVSDVLNRFMDHQYEPDGRGGLFTIKNCTQDLRTVEIWYQLCWYLDSIT